MLALSADGSTLYFGAFGAGVYRRELRPQEPPPDPGTPATFRVGRSGHVFADGTVHAASFQSTSADIAEWIRVSVPVTPGDVVMLDSDNPGSYMPTAVACSDRVAGVISAEPGVVPGGGSLTGNQAPLALTGILPVKVTNEGGPILPGDLLIASSTPGHAMRWAGPDPCLCSLVGKALQPMTDKHGMILVLLTAH